MPLPGQPVHVSVMPREVVNHLAPRPGGVYVDCTLGAGGHARAIAEAMQAAGAVTGRVIGFDKDPAALTLAAAAMQGTGVAFEPVQSDFGRMAAELEARGVRRVDGVIADLGLSSMQLAAPERGFSFSASGPLDMRMDPRQALTAEQVVNRSGERELADLIFQFGEERRSRRIARAIVRSRPLHSTQQLAELIAAVNRPMKRQPGRHSMHPATRTFQALRIYVNDELASLERWLEFVATGLGPGGRAVAIAFHSLEDRPIKHRFRELAAQGGFELLTRRAVRPSEEEVAENPRARSAKLRAVRKTAREDRTQPHGNIFRTAD